eukprot:2710551-Pleurochrysis_carterae.AAC.1
MAAENKPRGAGAGGAAGAGGVGGGRGRKVQFISDDVDDDDEGDDCVEEVLPPPSKRQAQRLNERNNLGEAAQRPREPTPTPPLQQQPPAEPTADGRD